MAAVDILMATYNGEQFVGEQIESIQNQSFTDWTLLVSDDCSTDGTLDVVRKMATNDSRISIVSEGVRYGSAARNFLHLLGLSDSPHAMFCDQDDVWLPEKIDRSLRFVSNMEEIWGVDSPILAFSDLQVVNSELDVISESFSKYESLRPDRTLFRQVLAQALGSGSTFIMNRPLIELSACVEQNDVIVMHDWWVSLVAAAFGHIGFIDAPLSLYRQHEHNAVGAGEFSLTAWAKHRSDIRERLLLASRQAGFFAMTFENQLSEKDLKSARFYSKAFISNRLDNLINLVRSAAWKSGLKKLGQVYAALQRNK